MKSINYQVSYTTDTNPAREIAQFSNYADAVNFFNTHVDGDVADSVTMSYIVSGEIIKTYEKPLMGP